MIDIDEPTEFEGDDDLEGLDPYLNAGPNQPVRRGLHPRRALERLLERRALQEAISDVFAKSPRGARPAHKLRRPRAH